MKKPVQYGVIFLCFFIFQLDTFGQKQIDTIYYQGNRQIKTLITNDSIRKSEISFYQNGKLMDEKYFINNKQDSIHKEYFGTGKEKISEYYKDGLLTGKQLRWFENGIQECEKNYKILKLKDEKKSVLDGPFIENYMSGNPKINCSYKEGKYSGALQTWYENKSLKEKGNYIEGLRTGTYESCRQNGNKSFINSFKIITDTAGKKTEARDGLQLTFYENGSLRDSGACVNNKKNGLWKEWNENGNLKSEIKYKNDFPNGINKQWDRNGNLILSFTQYTEVDSAGTKKSKYEGAYVEYFDNGKIKNKKFYKNGLADSTWTVYAREGTKISEAFFSKGLEKGKNTEYFPDGKLRSVDFYQISKEGDSLVSKLEGESVEYFQNGNMQRSVQYKNGKKNGLFKSWFKSGKIAEESTYENDLKKGHSIIYNEDGTTNQEYNYEIILKNYKPESVPYGEVLDKDVKGQLLRKRFIREGKNQYESHEYYNDSSLSRVNYYLTPTENYTPLYGRVVTYFENGQKKSDGFYFDNRLVGTEITWYKNGQLQAIVEHDRASVIPQHNLTWLSDGTLSEILATLNGKKTEPVYSKSQVQKFKESITLHADKKEDAGGNKKKIPVIYFNDTLKQFEENFKDTLLNGIFIAYHLNGKPLAHFEMKDGLADGKFTAWKNDGTKILEGEYVSGKKIGKWVRYFPDGKIYKEEVIVDENDPLNLSEKIEYYDNGNKKSVSNYIGKNKLSYFTDWYDNGQLNSIDTLVNDSVLLSTYWFKSGKIHGNHSTINGRKHGKETLWYENGNKDKEMFFVEGKRNGIFTSWFENGNKKAEGLIKDDLKEGEWKIYDQDGSLLRTDVYNKDRKNIISSSLACSCIDTANYKSGAQGMLKSLADIDEVRQWMFRFHAPVDTFYNHLFFINLQTDANRGAASYNFDLIAYEEVFLSFPDKNGLKLIFNPCQKTSFTRMDFNLGLETDNKLSVRAELEPGRAAIEFPTSLMSRVDTSNNLYLMDKDRSAMPSRLYFDCKYISYNNRDYLTIEKPSGFCFPLSEITGTGVKFHFDSAWFDFNPEKNQFDFLMNISGWSIFNNSKENIRDYERLDDPLKDFMGIYVYRSSFRFDLKTNDTSVTCNASCQDLFIDANRVIGRIQIQAEPAEGMGYKIQSGKKNYVFTTGDLQSQFLEKGFSKADAEYIPDKKVINIYFLFSR